MRELLRKYNSNRAPVGVYLHAARLVGSQDVADQYSAFFRSALALPDVWVVTVSEVGCSGGGWLYFGLRELFEAHQPWPQQPIANLAQVLRWMANPVPASQYRLSCPTPTDMTFPSGHFCLAPSGGCLQVSLIGLRLQAAAACRHAAAAWKPLLHACCPPCHAGQLECHQLQLPMHQPSIRLAARVLP